MGTHKTPLENVFFRASKIGVLVSGVNRKGLSEYQQEELERLERLKTEPQILTLKQLDEYDDLRKKIAQGDELSPARLERYEKLRHKSKTPKGLTDKQEDDLQRLYEIRAKKPELSEGAKNYVKEVWLQNERSYKDMTISKELRKGIEAECDALSLISDVDHVMYIKNRETRYKCNISGTCDAVTDFIEADLRVIDDTKSSWSPLSFMKSDKCSIYEWQGRAYMYLWDADVFRLRYCLVDCPPEVYQDEFKKFCFTYNIIDDSLPEYKDLVDQFNKNYIYTNNPQYSLAERVKTFEYARDFEKENIMLEAVSLAIEYYKTITLNMIE